MLSLLSPQVIPSKDIKVAGLLGPAARLEKKSINIADTEVRKGRGLMKVVPSTAEKEEHRHSGH